MIISDHILMKITVDFAWVWRWFVIGVIVVVVIVVSVVVVIVLCYCYCFLVYTVILFAWVGCCTKSFVIAMWLKWGGGEL